MDWIYIDNERMKIDDNGVFVCELTPEEQRRRAYREEREEERRRYEERMAERQRRYEERMKKRGENSGEQKAPQETQEVP